MKISRHENFAVSRSSFKNREIKMPLKIHFQLNREIKMPLNTVFAKNRKILVRMHQISEDFRQKTKIKFIVLSEPRN